MDLPWCDYLFCMPCDSHQKTFKMVLNKKEETTLTKLSKQYNMPREFQDFASFVDLMA